MIIPRTAFAMILLFCPTVCQEIKNDISRYLSLYLSLKLNLVNLVVLYFTSSSFAPSS